MAILYIISNLNDRSLVVNPNNYSKIDLTHCIDVINSFHDLKTAEQIGLFNKDSPSYYSLRYYYRYSQNDFLNNPFSYISIGLETNTISAFISDNENYKDVKMFYDLAKKLNANLWKFDKQIFIIDAEYLNSLKVKEKKTSKLKLTDRQKEILDLVEVQNAWFLFKAEGNGKEILEFIKKKEISYELIEDIIDQVIFENKLMLVEQYGNFLLMGKRVPYIPYKNDQDFKTTSNHTEKIVEFINQLSSPFNDVMYFNFHYDNNYHIIARSINGKLFYANFTTENGTEGFFGEAGKILFDFNKISVNDICYEWAGIAPKDFLINSMLKKEKVITFNQKIFGIPGFYN